LIRFARIYKCFSGLKAQKVPKGCKYVRAQEHLQIFESWITLIRVKGELAYVFLGIS
jgi:hypothetical protein